MLFPISVTGRQIWNRKDLSGDLSSNDWNSLHKQELYGSLASKWIVEINSKFIFSRNLNNKILEIAGAVTRTNKMAMNSKICETHLNITVNNIEKIYAFFLRV